MEQSIYSSSTGNLRKNRGKNQKEIIPFVKEAIYLKDYKVLLYFDNGQQRIVNFLPFFAVLTGAFAKFIRPSNFKKFIVQNGNIYWGKNEDVIFPLQQLYNGKYASKPKEEILYVF